MREFIHLVDQIIGVLPPDVYEKMKSELDSIKSSYSEETRRECWKRFYYLLTNNIDFSEQTFMKKGYELDVWCIFNMKSKDTILRHCEREERKRKRYKELERRCDEQYPVGTMIKWHNKFYIITSPMFEGKYGPSIKCACIRKYDQLGGEWEERITDLDTYAKVVNPDEEYKFRVNDAQKNIRKIEKKIKKQEEILNEYKKELEFWNDQKNGGELDMEFLKRQIYEQEQDI